LAIGLGRFGLALVSVVLAWFVLAAVKRIERWLNRDIPGSQETDC
jgi:uncharacterized membrane protein YhiD involved in acid resistance